MKIIFKILLLATLVGCKREEPSSNILKPSTSFYHSYESLSEPNSSLIDVVDLVGTEHGPFSEAGIRTFRADEKPNVKVKTIDGWKEYLYEGDEVDVSKIGEFNYQLDIFINPNNKILFRLIKVNKE